jgi:hypothetical protein
MELIKFEDVEAKIISIRRLQVIIDSDVADLYDVETRDINKSVKNNLDKFPDGYLFELNLKEKRELVEKFHRFNKLKHSTAFPKAFTEKGLYMLATILKSPRATATTLSIIETFSRFRELGRNMNNRQHFLIEGESKLGKSALLFKIEQQSKGIRYIF